MMCALTERTMEFGRIYRLFGKYDLYNPSYLFYVNGEFYIWTRGNNYKIPIDGLPYEDLCEILWSLDFMTKSGYEIRPHRKAIVYEANSIIRIRKDLE